MKYEYKGRDRDTTHFYTYSAENRLTAYKKRAFESGSWKETLATYKFSVEGNRIEKAVDGQIRRYVYDGIHILYTLSASDAVLSRFVYGNKTDERLARIKPSTLSSVEYYHTDAQGSVTELSDEAGNRTSRYRYTAFGETRIKQAGGSDNQFLYAGRQYDAESGLYYNRFRMYDAGAGRFTGKDAMPGDTMNPMSMHRYLYGLNNPTRYTDPLGLMSEEEAMQEELNNEAYYTNSGLSGNIWSGTNSGSGSGGGGGSGFTDVENIKIDPSIQQARNQMVDAVLNQWHGRWKDAGRNFDKDKYVQNESHRDQARDYISEIGFDSGDESINDPKKTGGSSPAVNRPYKAPKNNNAREAQKRDIARIKKVKTPRVIDPRGLVVLRPSYGPDPDDNLRDKSEAFGFYHDGGHRKLPTDDATDLSYQRKSTTRTRWGQKGRINKYKDKPRRTIYIYRNPNFNRPYPTSSKAGKIGGGVVAVIANNWDLIYNVFYQVYRVPVFRKKGARMYPNLVRRDKSQFDDFRNFLGDSRRDEFQFSRGIKVFILRKTNIYLDRTYTGRGVHFRRIGKRNKNAMYGYHDGDNGTWAGWANSAANNLFYTKDLPVLNAITSTRLQTDVSNNNNRFSAYTNSIREIIHTKVVSFFMPIPNQQRRNQRACAISLGLINKEYPWEK